MAVRLTVGPDILLGRGIPIIPLVTFRPLLLLSFLLPACGKPEGILIGDVLLPGNELDEAVAELGEGFPGTGNQTLRWQLLRFGMGAAALIHHRFPEQSIQQRELAQEYANRLDAGTSFDSEEVRWEKEGHMAPLPQSPESPNPFGLGARVAAATATLEEGEWAGPLRTSRGWEVIHLHKRYDPVRSRSHVVLRRLVFPVGSQADWIVAADDWDRLPLSGDEDYLRAIPSEILRVRRPPGKK